MHEGVRPSTPFQGLFINLDARPDRLARIQREFRRFGLTDRYARVRAFPDLRPHVGCFRSHLKAIELAEQIGGLVHILEDDSILSDKLAAFLSSSRVRVLLDTYDMLHLDMWVDPTDASFNVYQEGMKTGLIELGTPGGARLAATSSYVVAPRSIAKLRRLLRHHLESNTGPIDAVCGKLVEAGEIKVAVVMPFLTSVDPDTGSVSDIQTRLSRQHQWKLIRFRSQFFVERAALPRKFG